MPVPFKKPKLIRYLPQTSFLPTGLSIERAFDDFAVDYKIFSEKFPQFSGHSRKKAGEFSGGELRTIEIYLIVKTKSDFALLDEPFTHLNPIHIEGVKALLTEEKYNKGLVVTDHMYRHILDIQDRLYLLSNRKTHHVHNLQQIEDLGYARL